MLKDSEICRILPSGNSGSAVKTESCRPDPGFGHPRAAVLLVKIRVCSASFDYPRTSEKRDKKPATLKRTRDNIQLSRKRQRAVAGNPDNDPSLSPPHVESAATVSLRISYRNFQRPRLRAIGSSPAFTVNLDRKPGILGDVHSILRTDT